MESSVLLSSTGMIRSAFAGVELMKIRVRDSYRFKFMKRMEQALLISQAEIRTYKGFGVKLFARETTSCSAQPSTPYTGDFVKPLPEVIEENGSPHDPTANVTTENQVPIQQPKFAKIHDFCFGIPYGGAALISGLVDFIFSRDVTTLCNSIIFGGALLGLSTSSLKIWRQGKSSFRYILGQAVIASVLLWNSCQGYLLTKKIFPTVLYATISAAMLCFYSYVVISGGNPPPKKLKSSA
ncbi:unnamed protein product [Rhodiola kirilowii]